MKRSPQEMMEKFREVVASQSEDEIASYLEDISDSMQSEVDLSGYVERKDYDAVVLERDAEKRKAQDYRERYINRFYNKGNQSNDITIIQGGAPQIEIEEDEKLVNYTDLFE